MKIAFLFPGQGSQAVGMGRDLAEQFPVARAVFDAVDDALHERLSDIIFNGPADQLTMTEHTQPALMAMSVATLKVLEQETGKKITQMAGAVAGHSLGEYSALTAVGSLPLATTATLLKTRGLAMQSAVAPGLGAMAALLGMNWGEVETIIAEANSTGAVVSCANDNADGQVVISGKKDGVDKAIEIAKTKGLKRAVPLPVSAPFHSPLMAPAAEKMMAALDSITIAAPNLPLYNNITAMAQTDGQKIKQDLVAQVCGRVRFRETIINMERDGFSHFVEIGAGKVLTGLVKRIAPNATTANIASVNDVKEQLAFFKNPG
ncbi:MAG: ACP S-malonyltransferase [Hydrotalea sp.]|nr:ACP S-malonyltransferase [Hydrotalea sp.]